MPTSAGEGQGQGPGLGTRTQRKSGCVCVSRSVVSDSRILEWVAISFSRGSSPPRDQTPVSCIAGRFFGIQATREALRIPREALGEGQGPSARFGTRAQTRVQSATMTHVQFERSSQIAGNLNTVLL